MSAIISEAKIKRTRTPVGVLVRGYMTQNLRGYQLDKLEFGELKYTADKLRFGLAGRRNLPPYA